MQGLISQIEELKRRVDRNLDLSVIGSQATIVARLAKQYRGNKDYSRVKKWLEYIEGSCLQISKSVEISFRPKILGAKNYGSYEKDRALAEIRRILKYMKKAARKMFEKEHEIHAEIKQLLS